MRYELTTGSGAYIGSHIVSILQTNSFQAVIVTDAIATYAIFTYKCGLLNWMDYQASIGYSISSTFYHNHPLSNTNNVNDIACLNTTTSGWSNLI